MTLRVLLTLLLALVPALAWGQPLSPSQAPTVIAVTATSAANTQVTATLPAVAGHFHYITSLRLEHSCTAAVAGSAILSITTTNLPGALAFNDGDACAAGSDHTQLFTFVPPLKSSVVNTATTIVCPAYGATAVCQINVTYYTAP